MNVFGVLKSEKYFRDFSPAVGKPVANCPIQLGAPRRLFRAMRRREGILNLPAADRRADGRRRPASRVANRGVWSGARGFPSDPRRLRLPDDPHRERSQPRLASTGNGCLFRAEKRPNGASNVVVAAGTSVEIIANPFTLFISERRIIFSVDLAANIIAPIGEAGPREFLAREHLIPCLSREAGVRNVGLLAPPL